MKKNKKKAHGIQLLIRCVVRDPDGKVITDTGLKPAKSFLIQFLEAFRAIMYTHVSTNITGTNGAEQQLYASGSDCDRIIRADAPVGEDDYGIVVGTGDTAETNADYALETQLTQGTGAGNISHGVSIVGTAAVVGANVDLELKRAFINLTGSTITVKEAGLYCALLTVPGADVAWHCFIRDVLAASVEVPDKCSLTVYYTLRTTVTV